MITYRNGEIDLEVLTLLKKLGDQCPVSSLVLDIQNDRMTIIKVLYDEKCYGILLCRIEKNMIGENVLVIVHAIAHDGIDIHFNNILGVSLFKWAELLGMDAIRQHADRPGLYRMLFKRYGAPLEYVFIKRLKECPQNQIVDHPLASQRLAKITESQMTAE